MTPIEDKMRKARLRLFGHIRRSMDAPMRNFEKIDLLGCRRGRDRLTNSYSKVIRHDLKTLGLTEDMSQDRKLWRAQVKVADFWVAC